MGEIVNAGARGILTLGDAAVMQARAGQSYRPSNGTEGEIFEAAWCRDCRRGGPNAACGIFLFSMVFDTDEDGYPPEWVYGTDGQPCCTAFSDKHAPRPAFRCKATDDLFGSDTPASEARNG